MFFWGAFSPRCFVASSSCRTASAWLLWSSCSLPRLLLASRPGSVGSTLRAPSQSRGGLIFGSSFYDVLLLPRTVVFRVHFSRRIFCWWQSIICTKYSAILRTHVCVGPGNNSSRHSPYHIINHAAWTTFLPQREKRVWLSARKKPSF